jgi:predicted oxidoreductase
MQTIELGYSGLEVSRIGQGCMRLSGDRREAVATIRAALDAGIEFFDHADVYGGGRCEQVFAAIWDEVPNLRQRIVLQSKCGIRPAGDVGAYAPKRYDFSYDHIIEAVEGSLERLKTDYLDVLLLHRPDALVEPEEVAQAFDQLHFAGKVRYFGVSNHTAAQIQLLQDWVDQPLVANQLQLSPLHTPMIDEGMVMNRADHPAPYRNEGTLEYCRLHGITIQAWSPLAGGLLSGRTLNDPEPRVAAAAAEAARLAAERGVSREAIVIAWLLRHPARIQPIIGTTTPERIAACCEADEIELTREEWYSLYIAGRGRELP